MVCPVTVNYCLSVSSVRLGPRFSGDHILLSLRTSGHNQCLFFLFFVAVVVPVSLLVLLCYDEKNHAQF